jgi:hypothetical protein
VRGAAVAVDAVGSIERPEVELLDRLDHKPGEVVFIQPVAQIRRQQQRLLSVTAEEVLGHTPSFCLQTDGKLGVCATASRDCGSRRQTKVAPGPDAASARTTAAARLPQQPLTT